MSDACRELRVPDRSPLAQLRVRGGVLATLRNAYQRAFEGPLPPYVVPVEGVYKPWTSDPECRLAMAGATGYLMGDPAVDMIKRYQAHDLLIPDRYSSMPDHIALELEYLGFLFVNGDETSQLQFLATHLDWAGVLALEIRNGPAGGTFYGAGAEITAQVIARLLAAP